MEDFSKQQLFLSKIEDIIPASSSMVNELVDVLDMSMDSAYRRLRSQTKLSIDEVVLLCNHYKISFDSFINLESGNVTFNYTLMRNGIDSFQEYIESLYQDMLIISKSKDKHIYYACEDIPIFHNINFPEVASFKMFYWMKSILNIPELEGLKFSTSLINEELLVRGKEIYQLYIQIPSTEIWTDTTIQSTVKQVKFYWASGMFESDADALTVCKSLKEELDHIQKQAELGSKDIRVNRHPDTEGNYQLYVSDLEITNNSVLVKIGDTKAVYLGHLTFNTMSTSNKTYCDETDVWLSNLKRKSTLISGVSEKYRYQFFRRAHKYIDELITQIESF